MVKALKCMGDRQQARNDSKWGGHRWGLGGHRHLWAVGMWPVSERGQGVQGSVIAAGWMLPAKPSPYTTKQPPGCS